VSTSLEPVTESQSDTPSTRRLVIRIKWVPQEPPPRSTRRRLSRSALLLILLAVALPLCWLGISTLRPHPAASKPASTSEPVSDKPLPKPAVETTVTNSAETETRPAEPDVRQQPDAPPSTVNEVIPDVPRSALETIRGTVRVSVRVIVDRQGNVIAASADDPGPSRYFERLSVEASKRWMFTPASSDESRVMLVRFKFMRAGVTARATPLP
jgi:TonB family protein